MLVLFARRLCLFTKGATAFQYLLSQPHGKLAPLLLELTLDLADLALAVLAHLRPDFSDNLPDRRFGGARKRLEAIIDALVDLLPPCHFRSRCRRCAARGKRALHGRAVVTIGDAGLVAGLKDKTSTGAGLADVRRKRHSRRLRQFIHLALSLVLSIATRATLAGKRGGEFLIIRMHGAALRLQQPIAKSAPRPLLPWIQLPMRPRTHDDEWLALLNHLARVTASISAWRSRSYCSLNVPLLIGFGAPMVIPGSLLE
jgi:hypothetical protein